MIKTGEKLPSVDLKIDGEAVNSADFCAGKTVVLFGVPAAYSPTCSEAHVPGYVAEADALKAKGVDAIVCHSVNDHFVMKAWGKDQGTTGKLSMAADWDGSLAKAMGLDMDGSAFGLGIRSKRYAAIVKDGVIAHVAVEDSPPQHGVSSAAEILKQL